MHSDDFEEIHGTKHFVNRPLKNLQSSLKSTLETENTDFECVAIEECEDIPSGTKNSKRRKRTASSDNILNFLKKEAYEQNRRHEEMMTLEQQKRQVETERVEALNNMKSFLGQLFGTDL